ncbi:MAG: hypothetical protein AVDCRST_MAG20-1120, partial [uncultured Acidimicrobiales bacterium]
EPGGRRAPPAWPRTGRERCSRSEHHDRARHRAGRPHRHLRRRPLAPGRWV